MSVSRGIEKAKTLRVFLCVCVCECVLRLRTLHMFAGRAVQNGHLLAGIFMARSHKKKNKPREEKNHPSVRTRILCRSNVIPNLAPQRIKEHDNT